MGWKITMTIVILLLAWSYLDFHIGRRFYRHKRKKRTYPIREGNLELITSGTHLYSRYFEDLKKAQASIHILFYIVKNDRFSQLFLDVLKEQAKKGIEVRLLLDWVGSRTVSKYWIREAKKCGVQIVFCHKPRFPFLMFSLQQRNHRKITIIDNKIGYLGGYNVGKEYIDLDPELSPWRDYHVRLQGEGAYDLQQEFIFDWKQATGNNIERGPIFTSNVKMAHQLFPSDGFGLEEKLIQTCQQAKKSIIIGTPYFIPPKRLFQTILTAIKNGISVTILVPDKADHPIVKEASFRYLRKILASGGSVYQFENGFFHAKVVLIDDTICDIGTANLDYRSFHLNHEINCFIYDPIFISKVQTALEEDLTHSSKLSLQGLNRVPLSVRVKEWIGMVVEGLL